MLPLLSRFGSLVVLIVVIVVGGLALTICVRTGGQLFLVQLQQPIQVSHRSVQRET
jgi:hypothetical protein